MRASAKESRLHLVAAMNQVLLGNEADDPLDVLAGDHFRIRAMLSLLTDCARATMPAQVRQDVLRALVTFLTLDLPRHQSEEEELLFPRLQRRLRPGDLLDPGIRELRGHHVVLRDLIALLVDEATRMAETLDPSPSPRFRSTAARFVAEKGRHVAAENAVILPLARERLTPTDMTGLARQLLRRRAGDRPAPRNGRWPSDVAGRC